MKKLIILFGVLLCFATSVQARTKTIVVRALENFSTAAPSQTYKFETLESVMLEDGSYMNGGSIITGDVIMIQKPRRGKRDSFFEIVPTNISWNGSSSKIIRPEYVAQIIGYQPVDKKEVVTSVARTAIGVVFHGAAQGISFVQGATEAPEGEKFKSGIHKVYTDSFVSYVGKGEELVIKPGDTLILKLKRIKE